LLDDPDPVVAEAATWALRQFREADGKGISHEDTTMAVLGADEASEPEDLR
jgi:hypothetical protein